MSRCEAPAIGELHAAMYADVSELREFYAGPLGHTVRRLIAPRIRSRWRSVEGATVMGLGYAVPFMGTFRGEARRLGALMPAPQGALVWPPEGDVQSTLVDPESLPISDNSVDRLLVVHCLEFAEGVRPLLREIWRVLSPDGRVLILVPNRRGVWARLDTTPFGQGRPYSRGQIERLLTASMLTPIECAWGLHLPPLSNRALLRWAVAFERMGARVWPGIGGLLMVEARKEVVAASGKLAPVRSPAGRLVGVPSPKPVGRARQ